MVEIVSNPSRFFISQPMDSGESRNDEKLDHLNWNATVRRIQR